MPSTTSPSLTADDIDDLLYFTRVNSASELQETLSNLSNQSNASPKQILEACIDPENGNTVLHYCSANGQIEQLARVEEASHSEGAFLQRVIYIAVVGQPDGHNRDTDPNALYDEDRNGRKRRADS